MAGEEQQSEMTESMAQAMSLDGDVERLATYYDDWAADYDADVGRDYGLPEVMVRLVDHACRTVDGPVRLDSTSRVLDAGCGTGLVGAALHEAGFGDIHGTDLSEEMVERARERGCYRSLEGGVDLTEPPSDRWRRFADVVVIGGVFTVGHVPPEALERATELVRPGGVLAVSARQAYLDSTDFRGVAERLEGGGVVETLEHVVRAPYTMDSTADYWAWRVTGAATG